MRISISNIAWEIGEEPAIADLLVKKAVRHVDIAPSKYFADPEKVSAAEIAAVRYWWLERDITIVGMQSLLFGTSGLNLFDDAAGAMMRRLEAVCRIGGALGARALTFGSPRQRDRTGLDDAAAEAIAVDFFGRLGRTAAAEGVIVCLEPNPATYNCNFMIDTDQTAAIVRAVDSPAIRLQLDVGAMALNEEDPAERIARHASLIGHVHASEPGLVTLGDGGSPHVAAAEALRAVRPDLAVTIEMVASATAGHAGEVARAIDMAQAIYGGSAAASCELETSA